MGAIVTGGMGIITGGIAAAVIAEVTWVSLGNIRLELFILKFRIGIISGY